MSFGSRNTVKGKNVLNIKKVANMTYDVIILPDPDTFGNPKPSEIIYHIAQKGGTYYSPSDWMIIINYQNYDGSSYFEAFSSCPDAFVGLSFLASAKVSLPCFL